MKKHFFILIISGLFLANQCYAQYSYSWKSQNISVQSRLELQSNDSPYGFQLKGKTIVIDFATLGGMEGISGLSPSLDSYAESFGYNLNGKARVIWDIKTLEVARVDGLKDGQNLILCMMATKDFKKHFTCEIVFPENQRDNVESIVRSISYGSDSGNYVIEDNINVKENIQPKDQKKIEEENNSNNQGFSGSNEFASEFILTDVNGKTITLSSFRGKVVLLDFWGTWCGPCIQSIPKLKELYGKYGGSGFEIISIANDVNIDKWKNTVSAKGMNWTNVIDPDETVCKLYQIKAFPSLFLIDKNGKFIAVRPSDEEVKEYLKQNGSINSNQKEQDNNNQPNQEHKETSNEGVASNFTLNDVNGKPISLSSFKGKIVMLDFWGTWCGPCIQSIPKLKELYGKYGGSGFEIISIANDVNIDKWKNTVLAKGMNWTNVIDPDETVCKLYQIKAFPSLFLIDKNGKFIAVRTSDDEVEEYLKQNGSNSSAQISNKTYINSEQQGTLNQQGNVGVTNNHKNGTPLQMLTWQLLSQYSPDGYFILDEFYKTPTSYGGQSQSGDDDFTTWIDGQSEQDIIKSLNTVVHEMDHGFNGRVYLKILKENNKPVESCGYSSFYLGNSETRLVPHTDVYLSKEINSVFPANLITSRYETYVYPSEPIMGSQQEGVYGLLDEWNAYYNGTKTSFDLYRYYKEKRNDASGWAEFFTDYYGTYYAYLEFKSYILVYMIHAKKNYPKFYQGFMGNNDLLYSLKKTDEIWKKMILDFKKVRKNIIADLTGKGMDVQEKDGFMFINGSGSGNFSEIYNKFQEELKKSEYQEMAHTLGFEYAGGPEF